MHTTGYDIDDTTRVRVHYNGDCEGEAIFCLVEGNETVSEARAEIEAIQEKVLAAEKAGLKTFKIDKVTFHTREMADVLIELSSNRIEYLLDNFVYKLPLAEVLALEKTFLQMKEKTKHIL